MTGDTKNPSHLLLEERAGDHILSAAVAKAGESGSFGSAPAFSFTALTDITEGEELCISYVGEVADDPEVLAAPACTVLSVLPPRLYLSFPVASLLVRLGLRCV